MSDAGSILGGARSAQELARARETPKSLQLALDLWDSVVARHLAKHPVESEAYWIARREVLLQELENVRQ